MGTRPISWPVTRSGIPTPPRPTRCSPRVSRGPAPIRADNGAPFATTALNRLSTLSVWWMKLGIRPELIEPASPQQNARHERMHRTLKAEATKPPNATIRAQQRRLNTFRAEDNTKRPHEALEGKPPAAVYRPPPPRLPAPPPRPPPPRPPP